MATTDRVYREARGGHDGLGRTSPWKTRYRLLDGVTDALDHVVDRLVRPEAEHSPSCFGQGLVVSQVARDVGVKLCLPVARVGLWSRPMDRTAMPEAAIDEH